MQLNNLLKIITRRRSVTARILTCDLQIQKLTHQPLNFNFNLYTFLTDVFVIRTVTSERLSSLAPYKAAIKWIPDWRFLHCKIVQWSDRVASWLILLSTVPFPKPNIYKVVSQPPMECATKRREQDFQMRPIAMRLAQPKYPHPLRMIHSNTVRLKEVR